MGYREYSNQQHCLHWNHCGYFCHEVILATNLESAKDASKVLRKVLQKEIEGEKIAQA